MSRSKRKVVIAGLATLLLSGVLAAAQNRADLCQPPCQDGKIALGIVGPRSGPPAAPMFGAQAFKPVELAVRELNASGGLMGFPVELIREDDRCDPGQALEAAKRQIEQFKVKFAIGPLCPDAALSTSRVYADAQVVQLLPTVSIEMLGVTRPKRGTVFSMVPTDAQEAQALVDHLSREHKGARLAVVYTDAFYRSELIAAIQRLLPPEFRMTAQFESLLDISSLYDRLADKLQRQRPDVIYLALDHDPLVRLVGKLRQRGVQARLVGGHHLLSYSFWLASKEISQGMHVIAPVASPGKPELREIIDRIRGEEVIPDLIALNSYALVQIWSEVLRQVGNGNTRRLLDELRLREFATAVGPVSFDQDGNRRNIHYSVLTWDNGRLRPLK